MLSLVIAEAALETVPSEIASHRSIQNHTRKINRPHTEILLDRSYHHYAMIDNRLESQWKRGRPDIIHFALMEALSTPLYIRKMVKVYVSTINNEAIFIGDDLRIPKSYFRFEGLMIDLFKNKVVKSPDSKKKLLELRANMPFGELINGMLKPRTLIGLSSIGASSSAEQVVSMYAKESNIDCAFVVGGFPRGHFLSGTTKYFNKLHSIETISLESHVVIARILYECEKLLSIA